MCAYPGARQPHPAAMGMGAHLGHGGYHPPYNPQDHMVGAGEVLPTLHDDHYVHSTMPVIGAADYGLHYMPLPQAPRLPVAAARASSMAAMYYDPTLHPQHPFGQQPSMAQATVPLAAPWSAPFSGPHGHAIGASEYDPAVPYPHRHMDHSMAVHNQMAKVQQPQPQPQPYNPVAPDVMGTGPSRMAAVPASSTWNATWMPTEEYDPHQMTAPAYHPSMGAFPATSGGVHGRGWDAFVPGQDGMSHQRNVGGQAVQPHVPQQYQPDQPHLDHFARSNGNALWHGPVQIQRERTHQRVPSYHPQHPYRDVPREPYNPNKALWSWKTADGQGWNAGASTHNARSHSYGGGGVPVTQDVAMPDHAMQQPVVRPEMPADHREPEAQMPKVPSGPAPPSPDTLDKSAVPVSSVGAEIVWVAAAALLDPSLWSQASNKRHGKATRSRATSNGAMSNASSRQASPLTSPMSMGTPEWSRSSPVANGESIRTRTRRADLYDESSASSSEPGTPPSQLPTRIWEENGARSKRASIGALNGMRALGLSCERDASTSAEAHQARRMSISTDARDTRQAVGRQRSSSFDRASETIHGVMELLDRQWRWSVNEDRLDSLTISQRPDARLNGDNMAARRDELNPSVMPGMEPSPAFRRFAHQVLAQTLISPTAFMLSIMYSLRAMQLAIIGLDSDGTPCIDREAVEIFAQPPSAAPFKLLTLGLMIANKHLDDNTFLNKTWNEVTGISLPELNRAERWFLEKCNYEITVPEDTWVAFLERVHLRTEDRIVSLASTKRIRVPVKQAPDAPRRADAYVVPHAGSEEAHKRFLLGIEDALQALGRAEVFALTEEGNSEMGGDSSPLPHRIIRKRDTLVHLHQISQSAPSHPVLDAAETSVDSDFDVFDEADGPYRPYHANVRRSTMHHGSRERATQALQPARSSHELVLSRSVSDSYTPTVGCGQDVAVLPGYPLGGSPTESKAPLAPSALLDLLNRGQHLAHAAY